MNLDTNAQLELFTRHLEDFSTELGRHCAGLRLAALHLPPASCPPDERDGYQLLDLLLDGLSALHQRMEEELSLLMRT